MALDYIPQPGSGAMRVLQYFLINREELLTAADIASKFDIPKGSVPGILERAIGVGMLRIVRDTGLSAYAAGPKLDQAAAAPTAPQASKPPRKSSGNWHERRLPELDLAAIKIKTGTKPPPKHLNRAGEGRYTPLLDKLTAPDMSFELPKAYRGSLVKSVSVYSKHHAGKRKFVVRSIGADLCGVWRIE
jgi:hypothetical protein